MLSDTLLITEGSQMYLAAPALVKAAIGQEADPEELGGAHMHAAISGTADYREADDHACLAAVAVAHRSLAKSELRTEGPDDSFGPEKVAETVYDLVSADGHGEYEARGFVELRRGRGARSTDIARNTAARL